MNLYKCIDNVTLLGLAGAKKIQRLQILIHACKSADLTEGETCMSETEVGDYFEQLRFSMLNLNNFVDYEDIENPVKAFQLQNDSFKIFPNKIVSRVFNY